MRIRLLFLFFILSSFIYSENNKAAYEAYIELPSHKQFLVFKHYKSYLESPEEYTHLKPDHDLYLSYIHHLSEATRKNLTSTTKGLDRFEKKMPTKEETGITYLADYPLDALECDEDDYFSSTEELPLHTIKYKSPIFNDNTESPNIDEDHLRESNNALWHDSWSLWDGNTDHDNLISLPEVDNSSPPIDSFSMPDTDIVSSNPAPQSPKENFLDVITKPSSDKGPEILEPLPKEVAHPAPQSPRENFLDVITKLSANKSPEILKPLPKENAHPAPQTEGWGSFILRRIKEVFGFSKTETAENSEAAESMAFEASSDEDLIEDEDPDLIDSLFSQIAFSEGGRLSAQGYHFLGESIVNDHLGLQFAHEIADAIAQNEGGNATAIYNQLKKEIESIENKRKGKS